MIPDKMGEIAEINQALTIANLANLTEKELDELHHQEVFLQDQKGYVIKARDEGLQQGRQEGLQQGLQQGLQEGRILERLNLIQRLLEQKFSKLPTQIIDSLANLSAEKLEDLSLVILDFVSLDDLINFLDENIT